MNRERERKFGFQLFLSSKKERGEPEIRAGISTYEIAMPRTT